MRESLGEVPAGNAAAASLVALRGGTASAADWARVESWLTEASKRQPQQSLFLVNLADLRDIQGRYAERRRCIGRCWSATLATWSP